MIKIQSQLPQLRYAAAGREPAMGETMHRREFVALLIGGTAFPSALAAQTGHVARIGILVLGNPNPGPFLKEFNAALRDLGYAEGRNIVIELRSAQGSAVRLRQLAVELAALKVDVIVAFQTPAITAAKQATTEIPIVMGASGDPVGTGLIASLARPGGNITGVTGVSAELSAKNVELIREILPRARRIAVLANAADPFHKPFLAQIAAAGQAASIEIKALLVRGADDYPGAFSEIERARTGALIVQPSLPNERAAEMAIKYRLPSCAPHPNYPDVGGLMSYSADQPVMFRESASYVDKILKGRKPADLPVALPTKFLLVVNLKTASALGITLPPTLLTRADRVIE